MTTLLSRRSYRFVVFSAIITCGWLGVALALSRWVFRPAAPGLLWPELVDLGCLAGAAASLVVFFLADLRLRRNAAGELAGQSRQLELIADAANAGLWTWDLRTDQIVFSNRWCTQLGYKGADIENHRRTWSRLIHPEDEPRVRAQLDWGKQHYQSKFARGQAGFKQLALTDLQSAVALRLELSTYERRRRH